MSGDMKKVYDEYAGLGKKSGMEKFQSKEFLKLCNDAGLIINQKNKFNSKPPNRVDYVFTYSCTNGPGGMKGNKAMSFDQFLFALRGVAKETGKPLDEVEGCVKGCSIKLNATEAEATRFHDDTSNYTGAHKQVHAGLKGEAAVMDKTQIRRNRTQKALVGAEAEAYLKLANEIESLFHQHDTDGSGLLDAAEATAMLRELKPGAKQPLIDFMRDELMEADANKDGKLSLEELKEAYNALVDLIAVIGLDDINPNKEKVIRAKYQAFVDTAAGSGGQEMDSARWAKFCRDCFPGTFPKNATGTQDIETIYAGMIKERRARVGQKVNTIEFKDFFSDGMLGIVKAIKSKGKEVTLGDVHARVLKAQVQYDATETDYVSFHDDKSSYTGAQAQVFGVKKERTIAKDIW